MRRLPAMACTAIVLAPVNDPRYGDTPVGLREPPHLGRRECRRPLSTDGVTALYPSCGGVATFEPGSMGVSSSTAELS